MENFITESENSYPLTLITYALSSSLYIKLKPKASAIGSKKALLESLSKHRIKKKNEVHKNQLLFFLGAKHVASRPTCNK
jgi:hypothetical protein